jgi:hypothetical protein
LPQGSEWVLTHRTLFQMFRFYDER